MHSNEPVSCIANENDYELRNDPDDVQATDESHIQSVQCSITKRNSLVHCNNESNVSVKLYSSTQDFIYDQNKSASDFSKEINENVTEQATAIRSSDSSDLPVPSLRHRFALNILPASPSPELTLSRSQRAMTEHTDCSDITISREALSTRTNMDNYQYLTLDGLFENSTFERELSGSEHTSFMSPVPSGATKTDCDRQYHQTTKHTDIETPTFVGSSSITLPYYGEVSANANVYTGSTTTVTTTTMTNRGHSENDNPNGGLSQNGTESCTLIHTNVDLAGLPATCKTDQSSDNQKSLVSKVNDNHPELEMETADLLLEPDDNLLKWDYAGDLASRNLSTDLTDRACAMDGVGAPCSDRVSDGKDSIDGDVATVPLTWPSPHDFHRSPRVPCTISGRNFRSIRPFGAGDITRRNCISVRLIKSASNRAISQGSFICSPDPEELEDGVMTLPLGKLISDSGNMYSLRSESSLVPNLMDDGIDELESDEEPQRTESVAQSSDNPTNADVPPTSSAHSTAPLTDAGLLEKCNPDFEDFYEYLPSSNGVSLDNIDQVCLTASQSMLKLRRHADRVLEATETAERRLCERLSNLSNTVLGAFNESKATTQKCKCSVPEPQSRSSWTLKDCTNPKETKETQKIIGEAEHKNGGDTSCPIDGLAQDGLLNSPSWTSGSENLVVAKRKPNYAPIDLPRLPLDLSSGEENDSSTPTDLVSKNVTPMALPGTTQRTISPPFTEPTAFSAMTTVTPLIHTPGRTRFGFGDIEWDSKRSSLVDEHQDAFEEQRLPLTSSAGSSSRRPANAQRKGDVASELQTIFNVTTVPNKRIRSWRGPAKSNQPSIPCSNGGSSWFSSNQISRPSTFPSADEINRWNHNTQDNADSHNVDLRASTLSLPICDRDIRDKSTKVPHCFTFTEKTHNLSNGTVNFTRFTDGDCLDHCYSSGASARCFRVQPHVTQSNLSAQLDQPIASSTRVNSAEWNTPTTHDIEEQEGNTARSVASRPPPSNRAAVMLKPNSINESAHAEQTSHGKKRSLINATMHPFNEDSDKQSSYRSNNHRRICGTNHTSEQSIQRHFGKSTHSEQSHRSYKHGNHSTSKAGDLVASQLRYMLLKHRLKLARAKDAYLLRRRLVTHLELLLHKVTQASGTFTPQDMPADWDTDTSSLVTEGDDESISNLTSSYQLPMRKETQRLTKMLHIPRQASHHGDISNTRHQSFTARSPVSRTAVNPIEARNVLSPTQLANTHCCLPEKVIICEPRSPVESAYRSCSHNVSPEGSIVKVVSPLKIKNIQGQSLRNADYDKREVQLQRDLCELRNRTEKQLAEMVTEMNKKSQASRVRLNTGNSSLESQNPLPTKPSLTALGLTVGRTPNVSFTKNSRNLEPYEYTEHLVFDARASRGGVTWFELFKPIRAPLQQCNPAVQTKTPVKVIRESPRHFVRDAQATTSGGDTYFVKGFKTCTDIISASTLPLSTAMSKDVAQVARSSTRCSKPFGAKSAQPSKFGSPINDLSSYTAGDNLSILNIESKNAVPQSVAALSTDKSAENCNFVSEMECDASDSCLSGLVATPRGIQFTIPKEPNLTSSMTYRVMSSRSTHPKNEVYLQRAMTTTAKSENQDLTFDLQTMFKQRMSHWISRCQERQKRIQLAAYERRYNKAIHVEREKLFMSSQDSNILRTEDALHNTFPTRDELASCNRKCTSARNQTECRSVQAQRSCRSADVKRSISAQGHGAITWKSVVETQSNRPKQGTEVRQHRVRPKLPSTQQKHTLETKLAQLRTNRLRMKIYGEKVLRSVLQRRAPWSIPFKEI